MRRRIIEVSPQVLLASLLVTSISLAAQEPSPQPITPPPLSEVTERAVLQMIRSTDLRERAWGVYLAGEYGFKNLERDVAASLVPLTQETSWEIVSFDQVIFDSLIRLNAKIAPEEVIPYTDRFTGNVIILLLLRPEDHKKELLDLAKEYPTGVRWVALCNALAETKAPGFAPFLLRTLSIKATVFVSDQHKVGGFAGGESWGSAGDGFAQIPRGFPPLAYYSLTDIPSLGDTVIAPGTTPIYYGRRLVSTYNQFMTGTIDNGGNENEKRVKYLAELLNAEPSEFELDAKPTFHITCRDKHHCTDQLEEISRTLHTTYAHVTHRLRDEGLLSKDDSEGLKPPITIEIKDLRTQKPFPLPSLVE